MKLYVGKQQIHHTDLTWSGSKYNAARSLEFSVPSNLPYQVSQGQAVSLVDGKTTLFSGYLFKKELSYSSKAISFLAYDPMVYILKSSGSYNFTKTTLGAVVRKVAADLGIPVGSIVDSGIGITLEAEISINCYQMLLSACKEAKKSTKRIYLPVIQSGKLSIIAAGQEVSNFRLANKENITDSTYSETIENVINKVLIVDDKGNRIGQVTGEGLNTWGIFQDVYEKQEDKNATTEAKKLLHGMDREASLECLGDVRCISGRAVRIRDPYTGLSGLFYIDEDTHTWSNGNHTMSLTLNFKNEMEE
ncbi:hypothetical protein M3175_01535 [Robertmurraya korlensis]|uniref:XkdQ/YqbQ family protein n=1 Tax=Robertmurraya korlensis TaxID=519977 RepID=UPI00203A4060|nr:hypothetical protein [Robertmurraya korlensis]MCM3599397.1 hypothetical protein [Robertmurraya korlensis]